MSTNNVKAHKTTETVGKLNVEDVIGIANSYTPDSLVTALKKADDAVADKLRKQFLAALKLGEALESAKSVFKANGHGATKDDDPYMIWATEKTKRSKAMIGNYTKYAKHADKVKDAESMRHADDIIAGRVDPETGERLEPKQKTDAQIVAQIVSALKKLDKLSDRETGYQAVEKALKEMHG